MTISSSSKMVRQQVLAYHELSPDEPAYRYAISCSAFEEHLQLVARVACESGNAPFVVSFDDGHSSNYVSALPLLEKYGIKAIFFVIAGRIGAHKDFMSWSHLKELVALGHSVQSHGWSHALLTGCSDVELHTELTPSKEVLEQRLGVRVDALSVPHGRWDERVLNACGAAGYRHVYSSTPWTSRRAIYGLEMVGRLIVLRSMDAAYLSRWLAMGRSQVALHRARHAVKESARYLLGNKLYYELWARFSGWNRPDDTLMIENQ